MKNRFSRVLSILLAVCLTAAIAVPALADGNLAELFYGVSIYVDGDKVDSSVKSFIKDDSTFLPARAISNALGADVSWDGTTSSVYIDTLKADPKAAEYLTEYFEIEPMTGTVSAETYTAALTAVFGEDAVAMTGTTLADAVAATVANCGLAELPATYSAEIAAASTAGVMGVTDEIAATVATALDASLASGTWNYAAELDGDTATQLLMNAVNIAGKGRNYLGKISDPDILAKLQASQKTFFNFENETLSSLGEQLVLAEASTGYNLKYDGYNANFLSKYTIQYGHSDFAHLLQLIPLLNREGIDAKVALEPKTSIYEYMVDWGDPTKVPSTPTYALKPIEGTERWLCYALEFDLKFEFDSMEQKNDFDRVIMTYSKKNTANQNEDGSFTPSLIYGAWWQPLYTSTVPMEDTESFSHIYDNVIRDGEYTIHPFSKDDGTEGIAAVVAEKAPELKVELVDLYVNNAFYRYLGGEAE